MTPLELCFVDSDGDGFRTMDETLTVTSLDLDCDDTGEGRPRSAASDCDDSQGIINPDADEVCDGIDNNCDTSIAEHRSGCPHLVCRQRQR